MTVSTPTLATSIEELDDALDLLRSRHATTAVVMTMGALHDGHLELIRVAQSLADAVVVTIFVNPLQFGPAEDFEQYPRALARDVDACAREGVAVIFAPTVDTLYPSAPRVRIAAGPMGDVLCGRSRPGHFDGVLTVVAKLLHLTAPDVAVFGEKDGQQLALIRQLVADLNFPVELVGVPTVREPDGLALSSRNCYLSDRERTQAVVIHRALQAAKAGGSGGADAVLDAARDTLATEPEVRLDYLELVDPTSLKPFQDDTGPALLAVAAYVGSTRLIDNVTIDVAGPAGAGTYSKEP